MSNKPSSLAQFILAARISVGRLQKRMVGLSEALSLQNIDTQIQLERHYQDLQLSLILARQEVAQLLAKEKQLKGRRSAANDKIIKLESKHGKSDAMREMRLALENNVAELDVELSDQRLEIVEARQTLTDLESDVQKAYTHMQVFIAKNKSESAIKKADAALSKAPVMEVQKRLERVEAAIAKKEQHSQQALDDLLSRFGGADVDNVSLEDAMNIVTTLHSTISEMQGVVRDSLIIEIQLSKQIRKSQDGADTWNERGNQALSQNNHELLIQTKQRLQHHEESVVTLECLLAEVTEQTELRRKAQRFLELLAQKIELRIHNLAEERPADS